MSLWRGVPDFSQPIDLQTGLTSAATSTGWRLYPAADESNLFVYVTSRLEIARREKSSRPDFSIESVRGVNPFRPPKPYGVLDFRLRPTPFAVEALQELQQKYPNASVTPALFMRGWLRLQLLADTTSSDDMSAAIEFNTPSPLASNGLDSTRCLRRLTPDQLNLLTDILQDRTLPLTAWAEMELWGLAPRLPVRLDFEPAALLAALRQQADAQECLPYSSLVDFWLARLTSDGEFSFDPTIVILNDAGAVSGDPAAGPVQTLLAQVLADWTAADFAEMTASPLLDSGSETLRPTCRLVEPAQLPALLRWDLRQDKLVPVPVVLKFDPFDAVQQLVEADGLSAVLTETIVPPLETGFVSLTLAANLPDHLKGVVHLGVDLFAPPHPPERVQPLTASLLLDDTQSLQTVNWRFSPIEEVKYQYSGFAIVTLPSSTGSPKICRLESQAKPYSKNYLLLSIADFPLGFVPVQASDLLLGEALVIGRCNYTDPDSGIPIEVTFELNTAQPVVTLCLPATAISMARLHLEAHTLEDGDPTTKTLVIGEFPARSLQLDLFHLREYGPHTIPMEVEFEASDVLLVVDVLPEGKLDQPEQATSLFFTPAEPARSWTYFAASPFHAGYVYRVHAPGDPPPGPWSAIQSPFDPLKLNPSQLSDAAPNKENV